MRFYFNLEDNSDKIKSLSEYQNISQLETIIMPIKNADSKFKIFIVLGTFKITLLKHILNVQDNKVPTYNL